MSSKIEETESLSQLKVQVKKDVDHFMMEKNKKMSNNPPLLSSSSSSSTTNKLENNNEDLNSEKNKESDVDPEKTKEEMLQQLKNIGNMCLKPFGLSTNDFQMVPQPGGGFTIQMRKAE